MLKWSQSLYVGESIQKRERRIRKRLDDGKTDLGHYVLTVASNGTDYLDIIATGFLTQRALRNELPLIVGIAGSRKEAMKLMMKMVEDCCHETGGYDLRSFLIQREANTSKNVNA